MVSDDYIRGLAARLDPAAQAEFGEIERLILKRSMIACGMEEYPPVRGDSTGARASGDMVCKICLQTYAAHPMDWRVIGYGDVPFLNVLCNGSRVKL
jgi:hypothetical protein